jgi:AcrR family transcriptional regulator
MRVQRKGTLKTPKNLLLAASEIFAEKGYRDATIAEICKRAGANVAAVNYHFGNKETLYREAWRYAFLESLKTHPPDGGVREDASPEERLWGRIRALIHRISDEHNKEFFIVHKELANPTGLLKKVMEEEIRPLKEKMEGLIRELLGPKTSERDVQFSTISIVSQCINPILIQRIRKGGRERKSHLPEILDIEAYAKHVFKFSMAGIRKIREEAEKVNSYEE